MESLVDLLGTYRSTVDFFLLFLVFGAAARAAFEPRFPGHSGKLLAVAVGLALATSLTYARSRLDFTLESLGLAAASFLALLIFVLAFALMRVAGLPLWLGGLLSFFFGLVLLHALFPERFGSWIATQSDWVPALLLVALIPAALWFVPVPAGRHHSSVAEPLTERRALPEDRVLRREEKQIRRLRPETKQIVHEEKEMEREIPKIEKKIESPENPRETRVRELAEVNEMLETCRLQRLRMKRLLEFSRALEEFDLGWFQRAHRIDLHQLSENQASLLKKTLRDERERLRVEEHLEQLEQESLEKVGQLEKALHEARKEISSWDPERAQDFLEEARNRSRELRKLSKQMLAWERRLLRLIQEQREVLEKQS